MQFLVFGVEAKHQGNVAKSCGILRTDIIKAEAEASYGAASLGGLGRDIHGQMVGGYFPLPLKGSL